MPDDQSQTLKNHIRYDPPFHFFAAPVAISTLLVTIFHLIREFTLSNAGWVIVAAAFVVTVFLTRISALRAQDRIIRLEETLRMQRLFAEPLRSRIGDLRVGQFVALRFASDAELAGLVEQTLANNLKGPEIKKAIRSWRADNVRV